MTHIQLAIFDDAQGQWGPLADLRPVFDLRTGMLTTRQRLLRTLQPTHASADDTPVALLVPDALAAITRDAHPQASVNALLTEPQAGDDTHAASAHYLLVNAGVSTPHAIEQVTQLKQGSVGRAILDEQGHLAAALVTHAQATQWLQAGQWHQLPQDCQPIAGQTIQLLRYPWDIQAHLDGTLRFDLLASDIPLYEKPRPDVATAGTNPIKVAPNAKLHPMVVINAEKGPVVIDEHAVIGSFAVVAGPCYIGKKTIITPATHVRAMCSIGPSCVIGGEVSAIIMQGYANKAHAGYLGNSIVGQWVNLGADTNASNLKNTYGQVRMSLQKDGQAHNSKLTKLGPIIGDYVRTAIGSRLMTGSVIHTGAMLAVSDFAPKFIDRFAFLTDKSSDTYDVDKFIETARYMMSRRDKPLTEALENRLRQLAVKTMVV